jgi:hypothetical protein
MQTRLDAVIGTIEADVLTVYDYIGAMPRARRPTVCEARYRLRQAVRNGSLSYAGEARDGFGYRIRQYRRP